MTKLSTYNAVMPRRVTTSLESAGAQHFTKEQLAAGKPCGLIVGGNPSEGIYCIPYEQHTITSGLPGCGKTTSVLLPSVHACGSSAVKPHLIISDCKYTTYHQASGFLAHQGYTVRHVNARSSDSPNKYNVLFPAWQAYVAHDLTRCEALLTEVLDSLVQNIHDANDLYWEQAARPVFTSTFYALCERPSHARRAPTIAEIVTTSHMPKSDLIDLIMEASYEVATSLRVAYHTALNDVNKTWTCIQSVLGSMTEFYTSPIGLSIACETNFDPVEDFCGDKPVALFLTCPDDAGAADCYIANLFESAIYKRYVHEFETRGLESVYSRPVVVFMDEIARFPKCGLSSIMAAGRSRRFFVNLFIQSFSQFLENGTYSEEEAAVLIENCRTMVYMGSSSKRIGDDASIKSGGRIGSKELSSLKTGEAYVAAISKPAVRVMLANIERYHELGIYKQYAPASASTALHDTKEAGR